MARRTPLFDVHRALGARMGEFAGWEMPLSYRGAAEEHRAVRERCALFDVSHMGEIELRGPGAAVACQELTVNDIRRLRIGDGQYTLFCNQRGGVLDDLIVARLGAERYLLVVNAASTATDHAWVRARADERVEVVDRSAELALLALQGPEAELALRTLTPIDLPGLRPFTAIEGSVAGVRTLVSRTGYTGEDGFERLVGIELAEPGVPRHGNAVWRDGAAVGTVTSGTRSPTLGRYIGLAYVTADAAAAGTPVAVEIRGRRVPARVVARPFYRRVQQED